MNDTSDRIILMYNPRDRDNRPLPERIMDAIAGNMAYIDRDDDERLYCVRDWVYHVSGSTAKRINTPWNSLKRTLTREEVNLEEFIESVEVTTERGKQRLDFTTERGIYMLTQRMSNRSEMVREVKKYLAAAGVFVDEMARKRRKYQQMGRSDTWIDTRFKSTVTRKQFIKALRRAVMNMPNSMYRDSTEAVYQTLWERTTQELRDDLEIGNRETPRDHMGQLALVYTMLAEQVCTKQFEERGIRSVSYLEGMAIIRKVAAVFHRQAKETSELMGVDLVTGKPLLGENEGAG